MAWEFAFLDALQELHAPVLDFVFKMITHLGDAGLFWIATGILLLCFRKTRVCGFCVLAGLAVGALITNVTLKPLVARDRPFWVNDTVQLLVSFRKTRVCGFCVLAGLAVGALITNVTLKPLVARDRPFWVNDTVQLLVSAPKDFSFPSGHTQASFVAAAAIWMNHRKWGTAAFILAALIAFSRLYLYVHFPTDVLAGAVIGICVGIGVSWLILRRGSVGKRQESNCVK